MKKIGLVLAIVFSINLIYTTWIFTSLSTKIENLERKVDAGISAKVTATMYNAVQSQCDKDPYITAGMYKINPEKASEYKWIAVSRDLLKRWKGKFKYGDKVIIKGAGHKDGIYTIVDTMNKRYENRIDFLETAGTKQYKFENVTISLVNS